MMVVQAESNWLSLLANLKMLAISSQRDVSQLAWLHHVCAICKYLWYGNMYEKSPSDKERLVIVGLLLSMLHKIF